MNGLKARIIRKSIYGEKHGRFRKYYQTGKGKGKAKRGLFGVPSGQIIADDLRRKYQKEKRQWVRSHAI